MADAAIIGAEVLAGFGLLTLLFHAITRPASSCGLSQANRTLTMQLADAASAISTAAGSISTAAQSLSEAATKLATANDTSALDQPVADLNNAVNALTSAAASISALVPAQ